MPEKAQDAASDNENYLQWHYYKKNIPRKFKMTGNILLNKLPRSLFSTKFNISIQGGILWSLN